MPISVLIVEDKEAILELIAVNLERAPRLRAHLEAMHSGRTAGADAASAPPAARA